VQLIFVTSGNEVITIVSEKVELHLVLVPV